MYLEGWVRICLKRLGPSSSKKRGSIQLRLGIMSLMADKPNPSPGRSSNSSPEHDNVEIKRCMECCALLPTSHFGLAKQTKDGFRHVCKLCRSTSFKIYWTRKFGREKPLPSDFIVRNVRQHNISIINEALPLNEFECVAFSTIDKTDFKVFFGPSSSTGLKSICLFDTSGNLFREFSYSITKSDIVETILAMLKNLSIRLERTEVDSINSKTQIYFL